MSSLVCMHLILEKIMALQLYLDKRPGVWAMSFPKTILVSNIARSHKVGIGFVFCDRYT